MRVTSLAFYLIATVIAIPAALALCDRGEAPVNGPLVAGVTVAFVAIGGATASKVGEGLIFAGITACVLICGDFTFQPLVAALVGAVAGKFVLGSHNELFGTPREAADEEDARWLSDELTEMDPVRVVRLLDPERRFQGTDGVRRAPRVGDVGMILHEMHPGDPSAPVVVEMTDAEGLTVWLADFERGELERFDG